MTLLTIGRYLVGSREAILRLAGCRQALLLGLVFVLVAGLAREYDGEDLLHEPWHSLIPLAASLVTSAALYLLVSGIAWGHGERGPNVAGYLDFLGLYWLTAPLALVYAIPVERLLSAADATRANLWLLGLVALWRVVLMARVVSVLYRVGFFTALFIVMLFADTVAVVLLSMTELPIVAIMGGIRLSDSEQALYNTVMLLRVLTVLSWPVWLIGAGVAVFRQQPRWEYQPAGGPPYPRAAAHVWAVAAGLLAMWAFILPWTQPEQQLRRQVERDLRGGRIAEGLATMSAREPGDFPPHWDPPPRVAYRQTTPDITEVMENLDGLSVKPWVRAVYLEKFGNWLRGEHDFVGALAELTPEQLARRLDLIERMPERTRLVREHQTGFRRMVDEYSESPEHLKQRIRKLLAEAGVPAPPLADLTTTEEPNGEPPLRSTGP